MPPWIIGLVFFALVIAGAYGFVRALATGVSRSGVATITLADNPVGFFFALVAKAFVVVFCAAEVLHALGLAGDPAAAIHAAAPFLPQGRKIH